MALLPGKSAFADYALPGSSVVMLLFPSEERLLTVRLNHFSAPDSTHVEVSAGACPFDGDAACILRVALSICTCAVSSLSQGSKRRDAGQLMRLSCTSLPA